MSKNFTANQYESAFLPRSLQNWEVPKYHCRYPHHRSGFTRIIANTRGHLLPGVSKANRSAWGDYQGRFLIILHIYLLRFKLFSSF